MLCQFIRHLPPLGRQHQVVKKPISSIASALNSSDATNMRFARFTPRAFNKAVNPANGIAQADSGSWNPHTTTFNSTRKSQLSANSTPPPNTLPLSDAIVGTDNAAN